MSKLRLTKTFDFTTYVDDMLGFTLCVVKHVGKTQKEKIGIPRPKICESPNPNGGKACGGR